MPRSSGKTSEAFRLKVLKAETLKSMFHGDAITPRYGLGYELMPKLTDNPIIGHSGSSRGWKANFMLLPVEGVGIVVATNSHVGKTRRKVMSIWRDEVVGKYQLGIKAEVYGPAILDDVPQKRVEGSAIT